MAADPIRSTNLNRASSAVDILVHYELGAVTATGRLPLQDARQLLVSSIAAPVSLVSELTLNWAAGVEARVYGEAVSANNGVYRKNGGSGSGSWVRIGPLPDAFQDLSAVNADLLRTKLSSGELIDAVITQITASNGATAVTTNLRQDGFSIPNGSTGINSFIIARKHFLPEEIARLAGKTIQIRTAYDTTVGFLAAKSFNTNSVYVQRLVGGNPVGMNIVAPVTTEQVGTTLIRTATYTVDPTDVAIGSIVQISGSTSTAAHSLRAASLSWGVAQSPSVETAGDAMADQKIRTNVRRGIGSVYDDVTPVVSIGGGSGALARTVNGRANLGVTIPTGQTGGASNVSLRIPFDAVELAAAAGKAALFTFVVQSNVENTRGVTVNGQVGLPNGTTRTQAATVIEASPSVSGRRIYRATMPIVGDEADLRPFLANATSGTSAQDDWFEVRDVQVEIVGTQDASLTLEDLNRSIWRRRTLRDALQRAGLVSIGPIYDTARWSAFLQGGATEKVVSNYASGILIPTGQAGGGSFVQAKMPVETQVAALLAGTIRVTWEIELSPGFGRTINAFAQTAAPSGATTNPTVTNLSRVQVGDHLTISHTFAVNGTEAVIQPFLQNGTNSATAQDDWWYVSDLKFEIVPARSDVIGGGGRAARIAYLRGVSSAAIKVGATNLAYAKVVRVEADGSGDYATIVAALAAIADASFAKRYLIRLGRGVFPEQNFSTKDWVDIEGSGWDTWIKGEQADNTTPALIVARSTIDHNSNSVLRNMRVTARNLRYPIHSDRPDLYQDLRLRLDNVWLEHFGNQGAMDYQTSIGADPNAVRTGYHPYGFGSSSGNDFEGRGCKFVGPVGFFIHTNRDYGRACRNRLEGCQLIPNVPNVEGGTAGAGIKMQPLGSGTADIWEIVGCSIGGPVNLDVGEWRSADPKLQVADKAAFVMTIIGSTPAAYIMTPHPYRALRVQTAVAGATLTVAGTAATALFGRVIDDVTGSDMPTAVYGTWDVSGTLVGPSVDQQITSMGYRLGDCTSVNKTMTVTVAGTPIVITFDQNYTAQSNATILAAINAALSSAATASFMDVTERWRPRFLDEEMIGTNSGATSIRRKRAVAYADDGTLRPMTSADAASRFAGIALETIPPNAIGRVKKKGLVRVSADLERSDAGAFARGDTFGVSSDGRWEKSAATPLITTVDDKDVRVS